MTNPYGTSGSDEYWNPYREFSGYGSNQASSQQGYGSGWPPSGPPLEPKPNNMLIWAIVSTVLGTLCCCLPIGAIGIYYAAQVDSQWAAGRYHEAQESAKTAKIITSVAFCIMVPIIVLYLCAFIYGMIDDTFLN